MADGPITLQILPGAPGQPPTVHALPGGERLTQPDDVAFVARMMLQGALYATCQGQPCHFDNVPVEVLK